MPYFVGLDAGKRKTSICVIDADGAVVKEGETASDPKAIAAFLRGRGWRFTRVGMEMWTLAPWIYEGLAKAGLPVVCIEARQAHSILKDQRHKTDRNDARGIARLVRGGLYRRVHVKSDATRQAQTLLTTRRFTKMKIVDITGLVRGQLLFWGLKLGTGTGATFARRVLALIKGNPFLVETISPLLEAHALLLRQADTLDRKVAALAEADPACRLLMTAPCVGPVVALMFRTVVDQPERFARSRDIGPHLGLTPKFRQSGEAERRGRITKWGDRELRSALYFAVSGMFRRTAKSSWLKSWGESVAARRGRKRGIVATARRLAVILHRMWLTGTEFRWEQPMAA